MAINPKIKQKAEDIRKKIFGAEVRESLASGIEAISEDVEATIGRQVYVEEQFQDVLDETTGKDVINGPEIIAARNGELNLKTRLDDEHAQVTAQLAQTANQVEDVTKNPNYYNGAIFTIIDDDIRTDVRDVWLRLLQETGAKITFAAITDWVGTTNYMTLEELHNLQNDGHEIVSHTATHIFTPNLTVEQAEIEYPKAKQWLIDNGFTGYDTVVYPGGMSTEMLDIKAVARKHYKYGVATILTGQPNIAPVDNWRVPRINGDSDSLDSLKTKADKAKQDKSWMLVMTHSHILGEGGAQKMRELITYVQSLGIPIMTFGEAAKYKGNAVAIGEYTDPNSTFIGNNGAIKTKQNLQIRPNTTTSMTAPITDYPIDTKSIISLNYITDTSFKVGGVYEVFRSSDESLSYATFTPWNSNNIFMRKWDYSKKEWKSFEGLSGYKTGTWTPTLEGSSVAGMHTYASQIGSYSQNGNIITLGFHIRINYADLDSAMSGNMRIGGLPFTIRSAQDRAVFQVEYNNIGLGTNYFNVLGQVTGNKIDFYKSGSGVPTVNMPTIALTVDQVVVFRGQVTYRIA